LLGAAALPAMPAIAPTRAQIAMTAPIWGSLIRLMGMSVPHVRKTEIATS
jgi:hypothetical protein